MSTEEYTTGKYQIQRDAYGNSVVVMPLNQFDTLYHDLEQKAARPVKVEVRIEAQWERLANSSGERTQLLQYLQEIQRVTRNE
jgi:hypothetical protein